ncbi:hypothetical protein F7725_004980 [Dissostichus mawsoni]|uniref:Anaphase-promoting complex subunit 10 n=1 Tax=Dissostichus mawsoni TaxID=36200 RepID=A0A7J5XKA3_DISMA|nr:hypothetical protein F7725_004980 [Dissostichus mawsoni]
MRKEGRVDEKGGRVDEKGGRVDEKGGGERVDEKGGRVDEKGGEGRVDEKGGRVDEKGGRVDEKGGRVDEKGGREETTVKLLCIYADYKSDESYTPSKISVRVGNNFHNLQEIRRTNDPISTFMIQIAVLANHQNGRDTHMRQIKVYTPVEESSIGKFPRCTTVDFMMYRTIR